KAVVEQLSVRHGRLLGHKSHALSLQLDQAPEKVLETFVEQYYLAIEEVVELPKEVLLSHAINSTTLAEALFQRHGRRLRFAHQVRGQRQAWRRLAEENARHSMANVLANQQNMGQRLIALEEALDLEVVPERIESVDISHTGGEKAVAACVVFGQEGAIKQDYRRYNVNPEQEGDDYAALAEAVERRYRRV